MAHTIENEHKTCVGVLIRWNACFSFVLEGLWVDFEASMASSMAVPGTQNQVLTHAGVCLRGDSIFRECPERFLDIDLGFIVTTLMIGCVSIFENKHGLCTIFPPPPLWIL